MFTGGVRIGEHQMDAYRILQQRGSGGAVGGQTTTRALSRPRRRLRDPPRRQYRRRPRPPEGECFCYTI